MLGYARQKLENMQNKRKIRMGMVGGGPGSMIGPVHRIAARIDNEIDLVCGVFSSSASGSRLAGEDLMLPKDRVYDDYLSMITAEASLPLGQRMDFVVIVTPNDTHFPIAKAALEHGFHVLSDKPATKSLAEIEILAELVKSSDCLYGLTHTYAGYPMVKQARAIIADGRLGELRKIVVEYPQGWLANPNIKMQSKQAEWRLNPDRAGVGGCIGDIGVHASQLIEYISGVSIVEVCADLNALVAGRELDDDATVLMRMSNGARGLLAASQVCTGEENALKIRVYGEYGGLEWCQQEPNTLWLKWSDRPTEMLRDGGPGLSPIALANCRLPSGHPEGYLEAFANHYRNFSGQVRARLESRNPSEIEADVPGIGDALRGMQFIESVVAAAKSELKWHRLLPIKGHSL